MREPSSFAGMRRVVSPDRLHVPVSALVPRLDVTAAACEKRGLKQHYPVQMHSRVGFSLLRLSVLL